MADRGKEDEEKVADYGYHMCGGGGHAHPKTPKIRGPSEDSIRPVIAGLSDIVLDETMRVGTIPQNRQLRRALDPDRMASLENAAGLARWVIHANLTAGS